MNGASSVRRRAPGSTRSLSQRVRSTSTPAELEKIRQRVTAARRKAASSVKPGATGRPTRSITPKDVADRYDSKTSGRPTRPTRATTGKPHGTSGRSDQRSNLARPIRSTKEASSAARIKAARSDAAAKSAEARTIAARKKAAGESRDVRIQNARIKRRAQGVKSASNDARINTARQDYANRVAAARRKASAVTAIGTGGGRGGRGNTTAIGGGSPIQAGASRARGWNGGFNGGYGNGSCIDPYYNSCFWNQWGSYYSNSWCSWFWSPFYASGLYWQNYWLYGGSWGGSFGWSSGSGFNNCIWLGPFIPSYASFIIYQQPQPQPQVVYVDAEEEEAPAVGQVTVPQDAVDARVPADGELNLEGTDPGLQRELNRAAAYYLTQGDRAFREGRFGDAAHFYAKAVEFSSDSGILYLVLSDALFATGDYRYAAYALRQAFDREPELALNVVDKRDFYAEPEQFDSQLATLERYVEDHVLDMDARLVLAANYLFGGRPDAAWSLLENPFSEELLATDEGKLIQLSAERIMFGEEGAATEPDADTGF